VFFKFPSTPHLLWLAPTKPRADKVFSRSEALDFLRHPVRVEEKIDGANVGFSFDSNGTLQVQNRGSYVRPGDAGQFVKIWDWVRPREERLFDALENHSILFGEWCWARHSIHYTKLPDWFVAFDVFDKRSQQFFSKNARKDLFERAGVCGAPELAVGLVEVGEAASLIGRSCFYDGTMEGVYFRLEEGETVRSRAKIVNPDFTQAITEHWAKRPVELNQLSIAGREPQIAEG
jgi:hypothetical protein